MQENIYLEARTEDGLLISKVLLPLAEVDSGGDLVTMYSWAEGLRVRSAMDTKDDDNIVRQLDFGEAILVYSEPVIEDGYMWFMTDDAYFVAMVKVSSLLLRDEAPPVIDLPEPPTVPPKGGGAVGFVKTGERWQLDKDYLPPHMVAGVNSFWMASSWNRAVSNHPGAARPEWEKDLKDGMGGSVDGMRFQLFRTIVASEQPVDQILANTRAALDEMQREYEEAYVVKGKQYGILCFASTALVGGTQKPLYLESMIEWMRADGHLQIDWFLHDEWRKDYLTFVKQVVTEFKDHPGVAMWQLLNEPAIRPYTSETATPAAGEAILRFIKQVRAEIHAIDPKHPVSIGVIDTGHIKPEVYERVMWSNRVYGETGVNAVGVHLYPDFDEHNPEAQWMTEAGALIDALTAVKYDLPLMIDEFGGARNGVDRVAQVKAMLERISQIQEPFAVLQWGYGSPTIDNGTLDTRFGFDPIFKIPSDDWHPLGALFAAINRQGMGAVL